MIKLNDRARFILIYGLFLGFVLSYMYSGPVLVHINTYLKDISVLVLLISGLLFCVFGYKKNIEVDKKKIDASMGISLILSLILYYLLTQGKDTLALILTIIISIVLGILLTFISNGILSKSNQYIKYTDIFIDISLVMIIANIVAYLVYISLSFELHFIGFIFSITSFIVSFVLFKSLDIEVREENINKKFDFRFIIHMCFLFFLIKVGEGIIYAVLESELSIRINNYEHYFILPYMLSLITVFIIAKKTKVKIFNLLTTSISLIGIGFVILIFKAENIFYSNLLINFGYGIFDIIIWSSIIYFISIYGNGIKIASGIMSFHFLGMFIGLVLSKYYIYNLRNVYILFLILIFLSLMIIPKVLDSINGKLAKAKNDLDKEIKNRQELRSKDNYKLLSKREKEVLEEILMGKINRDIAKSLNIEETTVKSHCKNICEKLGVKTKKQIKNLFK